MHHSTSCLLLLLLLFFNLGSIHMFEFVITTTINFPIKHFAPFVEMANFFFFFMYDIINVERLTINQTPYPLAQVGLAINVFYMNPPLGGNEISG